MMNVIHVGLPKTASTTLQNRLFATQRKFAYVGRINNGYANEATRELIERVTIQDSLDYDHERTASLFRSLPQVVADPGKPILVSAESLSVDGRADRRLIAERLYQLFAPAKVLIVLRAQPTILQSMYLNHLRGSGQRLVSLDHWLDDTYGGVRFNDLYRIGLNYEPLVRAYDDVFGPDNVVVLPFELVRDPQSIFHARLAELVGEQVELVRHVFQKNSDNLRMSRRYLWALRIQGLMATGTNLAMLGRKVLPLPVYQRVRKLVVGGRRLEPPVLSQVWRTRVAQACAAGNVRLEARTGLQLGALGYPVQA